MIDTRSCDTWLAILAAAVLLASTNATARPLDGDRLGAGLEALRAEIGIPGMAVAVVHGKSVVLAEGYGTRRAGGTDPVDADTLFAIGSATKAFTATALGMAVDGTDLGWDDRVVGRLPGFSLADPWVTAEITLRDLLAHRSGLPPHNLMWLTRPEEAGTLLHRLRHLEPVAGFRAQLTYQNLLYLAAGRVLEETTGRPWAGFLEARIFAPLGMERTVAGLDGLGGRPNVATPHVRVDGRPVPVPFRDIDHVGPAGSISSSAADLARWLRFLLATGRGDGAPLIEPATLEETWRPQTIVPAEDPVWSAFHPAASASSYGMGWFVSDFHGRRLLDHGGGIDGMTALVALLPDEELGVAVLTNLQTPVPPVWIFGVLYRVLDEALGVGPTEWRSGAARLAETFGERPTPERVADTRPSLPAERYAADYGSDTCGTARVVLEDDRLVFRLGSLEGPLEHWHHDTFRASWEDVAWRAVAGPGWVTFRLDRHGAVEALELEAYPGDNQRFDRIDEPADAPDAG